MQLPRLRRPVLLATALGLGATGLLAGAVQASTSPGTVSLPSSPGSHKVTFAGHAPFNNGSGNILFDDATGACDPHNPMGDSLRDTTNVTVKVPAKVDPKYDVLIRFQIDWSSVAPEPLADMRMDLYGPDGKLVASSDSSQEQEGINVTAPVGGKYTMVVCAFQTGPTGQDYTGSVTASLLRPPPHPQSTVTAPRYVQYLAPKGVSDDAGEPSIGNNWKSGNTLFTSNTHEYVVKFKDAKGSSSWNVVNDDVVDTSNKLSFDPIGFTDSSLGRTFVSQLYLLCSGASYSDDDFATQSIPSEGCGTGINGFDHQTFGGGPYPKGNPLAQPVDPSYPHAVYYCSQAQGLVAGGATCARSDTGGLVFGPPVEIFGGACSGLHGHVRVAPDGTVYVPNTNCRGKQGVAVSTDAGQTWTVHTIPGSHAGMSDPSVSAGKDGTLYFGYSDGSGRPMIAVSRNRGQTWSTPVDAGGPFNLRNSEFAEVIAGDGDRAAFAFLGTTTPGSTQALSYGKNKAGTKFVGGVWHMYVATTYDRGAHWKTVNATPNDPVQRGCIWNSGGSVSCRNLLDFNDITVTKQGKVLVAFADGCVGKAIDPKANCIASTAVSANTLTQHGGVIRQVSGKGLFAAYDRKASSASGGSGSNGGSDDSGTAGGGGSLANTGSSSWLPVSGLALLVLGAAGGVIRRRRQTAS